MKTIEHTKRLIALITLAMSVVLTGCVTQPDYQQANLKIARFGAAVVNDGRYVYTIGGFNTEHRAGATIEIYDPLSNRTEVLEDIVISRFYHSAVFDGEESIYIIGGIGPNKKSQIIQRRPEVEVFNTRTREVRQIKPLGWATRINTVQFNDGMIYVLGGSFTTSEGQAFSDRVFKYDVKADRLFQLNQMPMAKVTKSAIYGDWLYTVGGYNGDSSLSSFERFNLIENRWETLADLPKGISAHALTVNGDKLYAFGNYNSLSDCFSYDFNAQVWQKEQCGLKPVRHAGVTTLNGVSYIMGGTETGRPPHKDYIQRFKP